MAGKKRKTGRKPAGKKYKGGGKSRKGGMNSTLSVVIVGVVLVIGIIGGIVAWNLVSNSNGLALPDFAYAATAPRRAPDAYQAALDIPEYLEQIPCYCGCGAVAGHKNNLDCYIKSRDGDKVSWDDHGAG